MSSLEPDGIDKYLLTKEQSERIFQEQIKPMLFVDVISVENPSLVIFGGQPGAGKSAVIEQAEKELRNYGGSVSILGDDLRSFHPNHEPLMAVDDKTAAFYTGKDAGRWVEKAIDYAKQLRCHVIIEGTMRSPQVVERTIQTFKEANYRIDARVLAVNERLSWQGVLERYENQRADRGTGRMTLPDAHQEAYDGLPVSVEKIEKERLADSLTIYTRGAVVIYQNELVNGNWRNPAKAREALEEGRKCPLNLPEYAERFDRLLDMIQAPQRGASVDEINAIKSLREQAYKEITVQKRLDYLNKDPVSDAIKKIKTLQHDLSEASTHNKPIAERALHDTLKDIANNASLTQKISQQEPDIGKQLEKIKGLEIEQGIER